MLRCMIKTKNPPQYIVVGVDDTTGKWFAQLKTGEETLKKGRSSSHSYIRELMESWSPDLDDPYTKEVVLAIAMGMDPGNIKVK